MKKNIKLFIIILLILFIIIFYLLSVFNIGIFDDTKSNNKKYFKLLEFRINKILEKLNNTENLNDKEMLLKDIDSYKEKKETILNLYNKKRLDKNEKILFKKMSKEFIKIIKNGELSLEEDRYISESY